MSVAEGFLGFLAGIWTAFGPSPCRAGALADPTWFGPLRGDLQMHTCWSDGSGTIAQMKNAVAKRGHEYIAIIDHSKGLKSPAGLTNAHCESKPLKFRKQTPINRKSPSSFDRLN
jgi:hypothetical protein